MITKGNKFFAPKGTVNVMEVSRLVSTTCHMGFLTFSMFGIPRYVFHEMETFTYRKLMFLVKISLTLTYVPK